MRQRPGLVLRPAYDVRRDDSGSYVVCDIQTGRVIARREDPLAAIALVRELSRRRWMRPFLRGAFEAANGTRVAAQVAWALGDATVAMVRRAMN